MADSYNAAALPDCLLVDHDRVVATLGWFEAMALRSLAVERLSEVAGVAALVAGGKHALAHLLSSSQMINAIWLVEEGCLDGFLSDPAAHAYLRADIPVVVLFRDLDDYARLRSIVPEAPLSAYEQDRLEEARNDAAAEAREEDEGSDPYNDDEDLGDYAIVPVDEQ
jgi:hypothetical protein